MLAYRKSDFEILLRHEEDDSIPSPFYSPHFFARLGLYFFGLISICAGLAFFFLIFNIGSTASNQLPILFSFSILLFIILEVLIRKEKPYFRAGLDEAFLYAGCGTLLNALSSLLKVDFSVHYSFAFIAALILIIAALRYADSSVALSALAFALYGLCNFCIETSVVLKALLPFIVLLFSISTLAIINWLRKKPEYTCWSHLWRALRFASLLLIYMGGNYLVVRELNFKLSPLGVALSGEISLAWFFNLYTYIFPFCYLAYGLIKKDRQILHAGLICFSLMIFTFRFYHHFVPIEVALSVGGFCLLVIGWFSLRFFKEDRYGISVNTSPGKTDREASSAKNILMVNEFILKNQGMHDQNLSHPHPDGNTPNASSDGKFGGGGASEKF